ncbi:MAG: 3-phosphoshikimate 1-carboxyvinyltransferase [Clostridia bacterium]|nr:3-phosphoshikimate 1-carboxyvinyltransferase [Clostridia bacterium]
MKATIKKPITGGTIKAIPSKSMAHRLLIASALTRLDGTPCDIKIEKTSEDIQATVLCLESLFTDGEIYCRESGSTFRFLLPLAGVLGKECDFYPEKSLVQRPIWPLYDELVSHGCKLSNIGNIPIHIEGKLEGGEYQIPGSISSQYITALLMALPLAEENSILRIIGRLESAPYVDMTLEVLSKSGILIRKMEDGYEIPGRQQYFLDDDTKVEGDWSAAAFWFALSPYANVKVEGLDRSSTQGDKAIEKLVKEMHMFSESSIMSIDVSDIPDLVPALAVASVGSGKVVEILNAQRLRLKESDRIESVIDVINSLGGKAWETETGLAIDGRVRLKGGEVDPKGDHRIAMMAACLSTQAEEEITILNAQVVNKSYPSFFEDFLALGGEVTFEVEGEI